MLHVYPSPFQFKHCTHLWPYAHGTAPFFEPPCCTLFDSSYLMTDQGPLVEWLNATSTLSRWMPRSMVRVSFAAITAQPSQDYYGIPFSTLVLSSLVSCTWVYMNFLLLVAILFMLTYFISQLSPCHHQQYSLSWLPPLLHEGHPQNHQGRSPVCFANEYFQAESLTKG